MRVNNRQTEELKIFLLNVRSIKRRTILMRAPVAQGANPMARIAWFLSGSSFLTELPLF